MSKGMQRRLKWFVIVLTAYALPGSTVANAQTIERAAIDQIVQESTSEDDPGLAVGIVLDGKTAYEAYRGFAELEHQNPVRQSTRFNIASNAKQFTALAVLELAERDALSLDDDVRKYFPELLPDVEHPILVRHLITHSSGIRDVYDLWSISGVTWWQEFIGNDDAFALLTRQKELNFEPGSDVLYSNSNYILLAGIVERVTGELLDQATRPLFDQLSMPSTSFYPNYMSVIPQRARAYGNFGSWVAFPAVTDLYGDGWLYTTLPDQLAWEAEVLSESRPMADLIRASTQIRSDVPGSPFGAGVEHGQYRGVDYTYHDGSTGAFNASFSRFPELRLSVVAMSNNGQVSTRNLVNSIVDSVLADALSATQYPERPDTLEAKPDNADVVGLYDNAGTGTLLRISEHDGKLWREIEGRDPVELLHEEGNLYQYEGNPDLRMAFNVDGPDSPSLTIYFASQRPLRATRVVPARTDPEYLAGFVGAYANDETGSTFELTMSEGELQLSFLENISPVNIQIEDRIDFAGYQLLAARDEAGIVTGFRLNGGRLRNVWFERETRR